MKTRRMTKTVILPTCDDGNRGDQALVWQTKNLAWRAGLADKCAMLTEDTDGAEQSKREGIGLLQPILRHPSTKFLGVSNLSYGKFLLVVWGIISVLDGFRALLLLSRIGRILLRWTLSEKQRSTLRSIESADACFVKGGGFIHTTDSVTDPYRAYFFLYHLFLAQSFDTPVFVMPNSFGPLNGRFFTWLVRKALSQCSLVTVREGLSQQALASIGVESELFPDLAFGLESTESVTDLITEIRKEHPGRDLVGITVRPYRFPGNQNPQRAYEKYIAQMAKFGDWLSLNGFFPLFIEHVVSSGEHESDISAIARVEELLETDTYAVFRDSEFTSRDMKGLYKKCDYVVGTRFHSVIFSLAEGTPALAIAYGGNKGEGIMRDLGLPQYVIPIEEFEFDRAASSFIDLVNDGDVTTKLNDLSLQITAEYRRLIDRIHDAQTLQLGD